MLRSLLPPHFYHLVIPVISMWISTHWRLMHVRDLSVGSRYYSYVLELVSPSFNLNEKEHQCMMNPPCLNA